MVAGALVWVVTVALRSEAAEDLVVTAAVLVQLKQYKVPTVKSVLGNVAVLPTLSTAVAVPMPSHAVPPEGQAKLVVETVQFERVVLSVVLVGKPTTTDASVPTVVGWAHTVPVVGVEASIRSNLTVM